MFRNCYRVLLKFSIILFEILVLIFIYLFFFHSRNEFEELPECVFQLKSLKSLLAHHNELRELSDDIGSLSFLEELVS